MKKHTKEICFRIVGYSNWWEDNHKEKLRQRLNSGKGAAVVGNQDTKTEPMATG